MSLILLATTPAWGAVGIDVVTSTGRSSSANNITTPAFSTTSGNQLLLAFVATDANAAGARVTGVTGASLTWVLVQRANAQLGTAEIWRAFAPTVRANVTVRADLSQSVAASITVITFTGVDTSGANGAGAIGRTAGASAPSGAPSASLVTTRDGSWVFGVGVDWDNPIARTVGPNQTLVYQFFPTVGDTYWVQRQNSPTTLSGTQVFINDTAPTSDRYNLSVVEVLPPASGGGTTYNISGVISPAANGAGATVTLIQSGNPIASAIVNGSGNYTFTGRTNGNYTVTPSKSGFSFSPASLNVTISGASQTANFSATPQTWAVSGTVSPSAGGSGTLVTLSGAQNATTIADSSGNYSFTGLANGNYAATPSKAGFTFSPTSRAVTFNGANAVGVDFTATVIPTRSISGTVSPAAGGSGTLLTLSGAQSATTTADSSGNYSFTGLADGNYTVTPSKTGYTFSLTSRAVILNGANAVGVDFTATVIPTWSISGTVSPAAGGSATLLTLSGAQSATTAADSSGNYSFTGLSNGNYTVTPSKAGYTFSPTSRAVTLNGANVAGVDFTATVIPTRSISGTVSPAADGSGTLLTLSGAGSATTAADSSGNYSFTGLSNGNYTVTPSKAGYTFSPTSRAVTVSGADVAGVSFTATSTPTARTIWPGTAVPGVVDGGPDISTEYGVKFRSDMAGTITGIRFYKASANTGTHVGNLWTLNGTRLATATFTGETASGWQQVNLPTPVAISSNTVYVASYHANNGHNSDDLNYFLAAGVDNPPLHALRNGVNGGNGVYARGTASFFPDQTWNSGNYWVDVVFQPAGPPTLNSIVVTPVNPTILVGATRQFTATGTYSDGSTQNITSQATWTSSSTGVATINASGLATAASAGSTTIAAALSGRTGNTTLTVQEVPRSISGTVAPNGAGATVTLTQGAITIASVTANGAGVYSFTGRTNGNYTVTPGKFGFTFTPVNRAVTINGADVAGVDFTATALPTFNISGTVSPAAGGNGTLLTLSGAQSATTTADSSGNYSFTGQLNGNYTVTPGKIGYTFNPVNQAVTINGADVTGVDFTATALPTFNISGTVSPSAGGSGTLLILSGAQSATTTADSSGNYSFTGLLNGNYTVTPSKAGYTFSPASRAVTLNGADVAGVDFSATVVTAVNISGTVSPSSHGSGTLLTLSGAQSAVRTGDVFGNYSFTGLANGNYTVTSSKAGFTFTPASQTVTLNGADATGVNFTSQAVGSYPDLSVIMPPGKISIVGSGTNRVFRYTHLTFNGGPGTLEIQPIYRPAAGIYQGDQRIYRKSGNWTLVRTLPISGAFFFHAVHGHFHFPFATFGLYYQNPDGSIGAPAILSEKNGFCIADSYIYDFSLPNAGDFNYSGGGCGDPATTRGLSIGAVDEYNLLDPGQDIALGDLPNGRYWLRAMADPDDLMAESDESNNATDVEITITGNSVTEHQIVTPVLAPPPGVALTSPGAGNVSGTVQLVATTTLSGPGVVQFLVDGLPFGDIVAGPPYTLPWNTTTLQNGTHWLAAQTMDLTTERVGTSEVTFVNVNQSTTNPPSVQITGPAPDSAVSAVVTVSANAAAQVGVPTVQFYVDGAPLGSPDTAPPYITSWNSATASDGAHVITATATDQGGRVGNASPVSFTVDNSNPPDPLGIDTLVFQDTSDTMQTPAFSTTRASDLVVAFVAYDGPTAAAQTATVSGGGLAWQLVMRSNAQKGTSEIWAAKATNFLSSVTVTSQPGAFGYNGSLTVIAFTNAAGTGIPARTSAPTGPPDIYVPGVSAGNWVFAVGNDWDRAVARTPVSGQVLVHQRLDTQDGGTYWVQSTAAPSAGSGAVVIHDDAPTNDQWNYAALEIVATRP